jgi:DNA-binding FadR family transcriptional regulator
MRDLLDDIVAGRYAPGEMLPREQDLEARWAISRGIVRETIRALEERGVLTVKHGRGATVTGTERWNVLDADVMRALLNGRSAGRLVDELLELRRALEVEAARLAAQRRTSSQLVALSNAVEAIRSAPNARARAAVEADFHRLLVEATGNHALTQVAAPLLDAMNAAADFLGAGRDSAAEHERIVTAIRERDPDAAATATAEHLDTVASRRKKRRRTAPAI